jgi:hypothetical protein
MAEDVAESWRDSCFHLRANPRCPGFGIIGGWTDRITVLRDTEQYASVGARGPRA